LNRSNEIAFSDRSHREEEVLLLLSNYVDLVREIVKIAEKMATDGVIDKLMNQRIRNHGQLMMPRQYKKIMEGRFDIAKIVRLD
jgi:NTE family protein